MENIWAERDGHDSDMEAELTDEICSECGEALWFTETGRIPPTREEPGEVLGYFECRKCGWKESI